MPEPARRPTAFVSLRPSADQPKAERFSSGLPELDRVLGPGGWVRGAVYLLSGDPGAGKSTLLLAAAARVAPTGRTVYLAAEEAAAQVQVRAVRLGVADSPVRLAETDDYRATIQDLTEPPPRLLIVDSIQRVYDPGSSSDPGSILQIRSAARAFVAFARATAATVVLVCHETKSGRAAGPNTLFHDVDAVLHLAVADDIRVLTAKKNRYGATDVVGLFRMTSAGLVGLMDR